MKLRLIVVQIVLMGLAGVCCAQVDYFDIPSQYVVGGRPWSVFVADFDGDTDLDLAAVSFQTDELSVMLNAGNGTFVIDSAYATGDIPVYVHGADVNGDSAIDLAVANKLDNTLSLFLNNGDGTFAAPSILASGYAPTSVRLADLNGDDDPDLIITNEQITMPFVNDSVSVMFGNGNGTFQPRVTFEVAVNPQEAQAVDLNGDNSLDLAVVNAESHSISVLLNDGFGAFAAAVNYESQHLPVRLSVADLDDDGDVDIIAPNSDAYDTSVVSVILNNGDGTFASTVYWNSGGYPFATFTSDLDHDGDIDVIVANWQTDSISVLTNNGDATFEEPVQYLAGDAPTSLFTADLNDDTFDDLAVGNRNSDDVLVYMNRGTASSTGDDRFSSRPVDSQLAQNVPNPFNPSTTIEYRLVNRSMVSLKVYNVLGQQVARLVDKIQVAGTYQVVWKGTSDNGKPVAGGIYFYRLFAGDYRESKKMVLLK